ncbi:hypothetical protein C8R44DRAFT_80529 [Mycena epipterygia]|nr:hypothetical protein C8R44DRAFT_80529 [Mycena epipterygia]
MLSRPYCLSRRRLGLGVVTISIIPRVLGRSYLLYTKCAHLPPVPTLFVELYLCCYQC